MKNKMNPTRLHLNELPWTPWSNPDFSLTLEDLALNQYPDMNYSQLRENLAARLGVSPEEITLGNGSDELIFLLLAVFLNPGDTLVTHAPTFGEYERAAKLLSLELSYTPLRKDLSTSSEDLLNLAQSLNAKMIILCRPNNPTGELMPLEEVLKLLDTFPGLVLVDEAYVEFSEEDPQTLIQKLKDYPRLILLRTFSKAFGLAGLRLGYSLASSNISKRLNDERPPYNINLISEAIGIEALNQWSFFQKRMETIKNERKRVLSALDALGVRYLPTQANFILLRGRDAELEANRLQEMGIWVRRFKEPALKDALRFSLGTPEDNDRLLFALKGLGDSL